jgi:hypothetical protein
MRLLLLAALLISSLATAAPDATSYPKTPSPKGLQVQIVDDLLELGVHHAGINLTLNGLLSPAKEAKPGQPTASADGFTFVINEAYAKSLDRQIKALSDKGVVVTAILITYRSPNERIRALTVHPQADPVKGTTMAANTVTPEGRACYAALTDFIARRWCSADTSHGRLWGWVISNEVNSHHEWHQMGPVTVEQLATQYEDQVRLAWTSLRRHSAHARVYLSMEHHWNSQGHADPLQACRGRALLEAFARRAKERGDFDWHLAFHPYPSNLRDPRTWLDKVTFDDGLRLRLGEGRPPRRCRRRLPLPPAGRPRDGRRPPVRTLEQQTRHDLRARPETPDLASAQSCRHPRLESHRRTLPQDLRPEELG